MLIRVKYVIEMLEVTFTDSNKFNLFINNINNNVLKCILYKFNRLNDITKDLRKK